MIPLVIIASLIGGGAALVAVVVALSRSVTRRALVEPDLRADRRFSSGGRGDNVVARFNDGEVKLVVTADVSARNEAIWRVHAHLPSASVVEGPGYHMRARSDGRRDVVITPALRAPPASDGWNTIAIEGMAAAVVVRVRAHDVAEELRGVRVKEAVAALFARHGALRIEASEDAVVVELPRIARLDVAALEVVAEFARAASGRPKAARPLLPESAGAQSGDPIVVPGAKR